MSLISTDDCPGISTGQYQMDRILGGGIPRGSLTLVEGNHAAGKSVLCQHLTYSALHGQSSAAYYTSETGSPSLISRMASLRLDVMDHFLLDKLRIFPIELTEFYPKPDELLDTLLEHLQALPSEFDFIAIDTLTAYLPSCSKSTVINFFVECREMCSQGKTIIITLDSRRSLTKLTNEIQAWCDLHLKLQMEAVLVERVAKALTVVKTSSTTPVGADKVHFDVVDGIGIHALFPKEVIQ